MDDSDLPECDNISLGEYYEWGFLSLFEDIMRAGDYSIEEGPGQIVGGAF